MLNKKTICLNMIVKNESHIILETLENICKYIDYWVICDTGSTDNTKEIIANFFKTKNINGELYDIPWKNFGYNRSIALEKAFNKSDYVFIIDADDIIVGNFKLPDNMNKDSYSLLYGSPEYVYTRPQIVNNRLKWRYRCILHEYIECVNKSEYTEEIIKGNYYVNSRRLGNRNKDDKKYEKDAKLLVEAIAEEKDKSIVSRYCFYAGQSFKDYGDNENAIKYYKKRIEYGGWNEEIYISYIEIGLAMIRQKYPKEDIIKAFINAYKTIPMRTESLYHLAMYYCSINDYINAHKIALILIKIKHSDEYRLFVQKDIALWRTTILLYYIYDTIIHNKIVINNMSENWIIEKKDNLFKMIMGNENIPKREKENIRNSYKKTNDLEGYDFYPNIDSFGNDIGYYGNLTIEQLKDMADIIDDCIGFNTYGYLKNKINDNMIELHNQFHDCDGLYIKKGYKNHEQMKLKKNDSLKLEGYKFKPNKDSCGYDIKYYPNKTIHELKEIADMYNECVGFNTYGYIKYKLNTEFIDLKNIKYDIDGLYVKTNNQTQKDINKYNYYNEKLINQITENIKDKHNKKITFSITTCKRLDLFEKTMNSFINCCLDIMLIDEYICIDDNSSEDDRNKMKQLYPFMRWIWKGPEQKGHLSSMNMLLEQVKTEYLLHIEDDWLFYDQCEYIKPSIEIMEQKKIISIDDIPEDQNINNKTIKQVLFNKNYIEVEEQNIIGGYLCKTETGNTYIIHEHYDSKTDEARYNEIIEKYNGPTCVYWPHYSFRPSLLKTDIFKSIGKYNCDGSFFEKEYAYQYYEKGYISCFFNKTTCRHIGKLTTEKGYNAYTLNNVSQFTNQNQNKDDEICLEKDYIINDTKNYKIVCINLERRVDRKEKMKHIFDEANINNYEFYKAIDGNTLEPTRELYKIFHGNDFGNRRGVIGCALSHINLWKELINSNYDYYLIFEDDIELTDNFKTKVTSILNNVERYDILFLGYSMFKDIRAKYGNIYDIKNDNTIKIETLKRNLYIGGLYSYIITKKGAEKLINHINKNGIKHGIDYVIKINNDLNLYETQPWLTFTDWVDNPNSLVDTDIQKNYDKLDFVDNEWIFYKNLDAPGNDIAYIEDATIEKLFDIANDNKECVAFNTLGFIKNYADIDNLMTNIYVQGNEGIYINKQRIDQIKWVFYKGLDYIGNDICQTKYESLDTLILEANNNQQCCAFNTLGYLKNYIDIRRLCKSKYLSQNDGIYVRKDRIMKINTMMRQINMPNNIKVKMICNWTDTNTLREEWSNLMMEKYRWNNIVFTCDDDAEYYVIINKPILNEYYDPNKTIIFQMEPWCNHPEQHWGIKTWGEWAEPDPNKFLHVRTHKKYYNNGFWQLKQNWTELKNNKIIKDPSKGNKISTICSSKYFDPGHIKRIDFLKYVESKNDPNVTIDIYNHDNNHKFKNYKGQHPQNNKDIGITPYKYYFMAENNVEYNFITEKLWEPLLTESLCFYWGCPNVKDYINPLAYVVLDLNDFEKSFNIIKNAIIENLWEKRIDIIRKEKQKVLDYYAFCPTLERIIIDDIKYNKFFKSLCMQNMKHVCFIHSCTINNDITTLDKLINIINNSGLLKMLDKIFIINIGDDIINKYESKKINIINYSSDKTLFEIPTINLIHAFSAFNKDVKILYLHTKGISYKGSKLYDRVVDWIDMMLYFLVEKYDNCLDKLDNYDAIGCNYLEYPQHHFSGNFWWANSNYIEKLFIIFSNDKYDAEWWILDNDNVKYLSLYNSNIDHYLASHPRNKYAIEKN